MRLQSSIVQSRSFNSSYLLANCRQHAFSFSLFVFAGLAHCQEATIVGTVTDPSGAVVPNPKSQVTNTDKNQDV